MTQKERIEICKACKFSELDLRLGTVCIYTSKVPDFEDECEKYKGINHVDENTTSEPLVEKVKRTWTTPLLLSILGFARAALKGFDDPFGVIFFLIAVIWLIIALATVGSKEK